MHSPSRVRPQITDAKVMAVVAFWKRKVLCYEILDQGETMTGQRFLSFLEDTLRPAIRRKRIVRPTLLMDNARPHYARYVADFIVERKWSLLKQDPYSPDQQPCDSDGFERLKRPLRGTRFNSIDALITAFKGSIDEVNESESFVGISKLPETWQMIIDKKGGYVT